MFRISFSLPGKNWKKGLFEKVSLWRQNNITRNNSEFFLCRSMWFYYRNCDVWKITWLSLNIFQSKTPTTNYFSIDNEWNYFTTKCWFIVCIGFQLESLREIDTGTEYEKKNKRYEEGKESLCNVYMARVNKAGEMEKVNEKYLIDSKSKPDTCLLAFLRKWKSN